MSRVYWLILVANMELITPNLRMFTMIYALKLVMFQRYVNVYQKVSTIIGHV